MKRLAQLFWLAPRRLIVIAIRCYQMLISPFLHESYSENVYRRAIHKACNAANIPVWGPGRLRHNAATRLKSQYGWEAARVLLGHSHRICHVRGVKLLGDLIIERGQRIGLLL